MVNICDPLSKNQHFPQILKVSWRRSILSGQVIFQLNSDSWLLNMGMRPSTKSSCTHLDHKNNKWKPHPYVVSHSSYALEWKNVGMRLCTVTFTFIILLACFLTCHSYIFLYYICNVFPFYIYIAVINFLLSTGTYQISVQQVSVVLFTVKIFYLA